MSFLNCRFTAEITYHDVLHGLRARRGIGTDALGDKLLQKLTATREAVLFEVFLYIQKSYDALDQERSL